MATYIVLNLLFLTTVLGVLVWRKLLTFGRAVWVTLVVLLVTTIVFDSLLIHLGMFTYPADKILGIRIGLAPIEDLFYSLLAGLAVPAIWKGLNRERKINVLFMTSRPLSWVNTAYPFAAGYVVMGGAIDARLIIGTLFFLIPYNLLMYGINDVCDYESDMRNPRKGGVEGAVTPRKYHRLIVWSAVLSCLPFVLALVLLGNWQSALVLAVVLFFVVAYSAKGLRFKEVPLLDSVTSSLHFVGPLLYAYSLVGTTQAGWLAAAAFFCWGMASQAFGAVQDIVPDREAKIRSIATVFGARSTVWLAILLYAAAVGLVACLGVAAWPVASAGSLYIINLLPFVRIRDERSVEARAGWRRFLWLNYVAGAVVTVTLLMKVWGV